MPSLFLLSFCPNSSVSAGRGVCLQCRTTCLCLSHHFIVTGRYSAILNKRTSEVIIFLREQAKLWHPAWHGELCRHHLSLSSYHPTPLVALLNVFKSPECEKKTVSPLLQTQCKWEGASINKPLKSCQYMNIYFYLAFPIRFNTRNLPSHPRGMNGLNIRSCHTATVINREGSLQVSTCKTNLYNPSEPEDRTS